MDVGPGLVCRQFAVYRHTACPCSAPVGSIGRTGLNSTARPEDKTRTVVLVVCLLSRRFCGPLWRVLDASARAGGAVRRPAAPATSSRRSSSRAPRLGRRRPQLGARPSLGQDGPTSPTTYLSFNRNKARRRPGHFQPAGRALLSRCSARVTWCLRISARHSPRSFGLSSAQLLEVHPRRRLLDLAFGAQPGRCIKLPGYDVRPSMALSGLKEQSPARSEGAVQVGVAATDVFCAVCLRRRRTGVPL